MNPFGHTRSRVTSHYALITPDTEVVSPLVGWTNATQVLHIAPEMGARFLMFTARLESAAKSGSPGAGVERFVYMSEGKIDVELIGNHQLGPGEFAFIPADTPHEITTSADAKGVASLIVFEKRHLADPYGKRPQPVFGSAADTLGEPFMGDDDARLQTFLPVEPEFDMAVNRFTYQPGATLPQVEIHRMEHGLVMLSGAGVYRLGDDYFPVQAGDVIWMASYCPQWFVAMGKQPAVYLYYKDIHRDRLCDRG